MKYGWSKIKSRANTLRKKCSAYQEVSHTFSAHYIDFIYESVKKLSYTENYKKLRGFIQSELVKIAGDRKGDQWKINIVWLMSFLYWMRIRIKTCLLERDIFHFFPMKIMTKTHISSHNNVISK